MKTITQIRIGSSNSRKVHSLYHELFIKKHFVDAYVSVINGVHEGMSFTLLKEHIFKFIGKYCHHLQVLDALNYPLCLYKLGKIPSSLRYFACESVEWYISSERAAEEILTLFPSLEAVYGDWDDAYMYEDDDASTKLSLLLCKRLAENTKQSPKVVNPSKGLMSDETFEALAVRGIKYLEYRIDISESDSVHPILPNVANGLSALSIDFLPNDYFCQGPLPLLTHLQIRTFRYQAGTHSNVLFSSPILKSIRLEATLGRRLLSSLLSHLHSLEQLRHVNLNIKFKPEPDEEVVRFSLPGNVRHFSLITDAPYEIVSCRLQSLSELQVTYLLNQDFDLPHLRTLKVQKAPMKRARGHSLTGAFVTSLSRSLQLEELSFEMDVEEVPSTAYLHSLLEVCSKLSLKKLTLEIKQHGGVDADQPSNGTVVVNHVNFPFVQTFKLNLPYDIVFHSEHPFEKMELSSNRRRLELHGRASRFEFSGGNPLAIFGSDNGPSHISFTLWSDVTKHMQLIPQLEQLNHVKKFSVINRHSFTEEQDEWRLFQLFMPLFKQIEYFSFDGEIQSRSVIKLFDLFSSLEHLKTVQFVKVDVIPHEELPVR